MAGSGRADVLSQDISVIALFIVEFPPRLVLELPLSDLALVPTCTQPQNQPYTPTRTPALLPAPRAAGTTISNREAPCPCFVPDTPYSPPTVCCPPSHPSTRFSPAVAANPTLQQPYPATSTSSTLLRARNTPSVTTLTLRIIPILSPNTRIPSMNMTPSTLRSVDTKPARSFITVSSIICTQGE
ncbi:hypothetical protein H2248_011180 [Termitomyces sp. 'cryptogamus']|nr:hypothetical protein H2248_011180 [Termitomyces sp. 'cryptogamus']